MKGDDRSREVVVGPVSVPVLCHTTLLEKHEKKSIRSGVAVQSFMFVPLPPLKRLLRPLIV